MPKMKFKDNELLMIDIARKNGKLLLSDIAEVYDIALINNTDRDSAYRKISRLLALEILVKSVDGIKFENRRNIPEGCFNLEWQESLSKVI